MVPLHIPTSMRYWPPISGRARKRPPPSGKNNLVSEMILQIGRIILVIFEVLVIFNLLIVVHEIGHFLAARWRGLYVEKFGVWFGKPLWKKKIDGVQYSLGSLPFGGFVALPQLAPMDIIEGKADVDRAHLPPVSALDKIIVAVAGPFFSLLLAIVFAAIVWIVGYPVSDSVTHRSTIRSRCLSTLKNILTKHWRSRWSAVVRGSRCR